MKNWSHRPVEVAYLFNPAFCGEVLLRSIETYSKHSTNEEGLSFPLAFLILPLVLHKKTRERIPATTKNTLHYWLRENGSALIGFPMRARNLVPLTREAITFLIQLQMIQVVTEGRLVRTTKRHRRSSGFEPDVEIEDCLSKAETIGKWFARAGTPSTVYFTLGVKP